VDESPIKQAMALSAAQLFTGENSMLNVYRKIAFDSWHSIAGCKVKFF
jgi:hypothetical protein